MPMKTPHKEFPGRPSAAQTGFCTDEEAFTVWYEQSAPSVLRVLTWYTGDLVFAQDAVAEAFCRAWTRRRSIGTTGAAEGWVMRVALNLAKRRGRPTALLERLRDRSVTEPSWLAPDETDVDLWSAVIRLPSRQREVIALKYVAGHTEREIAETLGMSLGGVSASLAKARERLREELNVDD